MPPSRLRPTRAELLAARDKLVPDLLARNLKVLFCGINPGLYSAAIGHHFGRPGNRFWPALHLGGLTPRQLTPYEERELLPLGYGVTNIASRATATADGLSPEELRAGVKPLKAKLRRYKPRMLAVLGIMAYRIAFDRPDATLGLQDEPIEGTRVWILPNPSGLNAHYTLRDLGELFARLRRAADEI